MKNTKILVLFVVLVTLATLACGPLGGGDQPSEEAKEAATPTVEQEVEEELNLSDVTEGLTTLKSYKAKMNIQFAGKDENGQPASGSVEWIREFIAEPKAQRVVLTITGFEAEMPMESGALEIITLADTSYMVMQEQDGTRSCISVSGGQSLAPEDLFSPDTFGISGAKYVKTETVNDVRTKRYAWQEGGLTGLGFTTSKGDVWIAMDGDYAVKFTAEATGKGTLFGTLAGEGTVNVEYNLTDVNEQFEIEPPADCESPATDIPLMADAQDKSTLGGLVSYTSASAFADVVQFYKDEMPQAGWEPSGEPTEMPGLAMLEFTKEGRKAQLTISEDTEKKLTNVVITTSEE
jgi:hypothetical protein